VVALAIPGTAIALTLLLARCAVTVVPSGPPVAAAAAEFVQLPAIDPQTPLADLLPAAPAANAAPVYLGDDLAGVPELALEAAPPGLTTPEWRARKARTSAAALHLDGKEEDGFLKALLRARPDLSGLPFLMGGACRTEGERRTFFKDAAEKLRRAPQAALLDDFPPDARAEESRRHHWQAHAAVAAQVLPAEPPGVQLQLVAKLASIPRPEATRALARVAVFAADEAIRSAAVEALSVRREADCTEVLVGALSYPWPPAAGNAARAITRLGRKDLAGHLVALLDAPDPRGPCSGEVAGHKVTVARELVRVNHLRNCLLCHAPAEPSSVPEGTLLAEVPVPTEPLSAPSEGYGNSGSPVLVRVDVTYLRQDFSAPVEVKERSAWPTAQRFDFVVRRRVLTADEAADLRARLEERERDGQSPYRQAAAEALRRLTGRDFGADAAAWRRHLEGKPS
jgi:hypothetical protein